MNDELKQLIEDAAKLIGLEEVHHCYDFDEDGERTIEWICSMGKRNGVTIKFDPCDPERGDLMKVADAAELEIRFNLLSVVFYGPAGLQVMIPFEKGDYQSLAEAVLRAASAVLRARGE